LKQATADDIARVEGIPRPLAERIADFFAHQKQATTP
jgi:excinuclease UvrABC nuclease subunit